MKINTRNIFLSELIGQVIVLQSGMKSTKNAIALLSCDRTLDAPELLDDFYLSLLDWGNSNLIAIALGNLVYLWDASSGSSSKLLSIDDEIGPVTSVRWAPDGRRIEQFSCSAVGLGCRPPPEDSTRRSCSKSWFT